MKFHKNMTNLEIAELLRAVAASYQLKGEEKNRFRIIAYQRAADAVEHATSEIKDLWDDGKLKDIPGIGESIASHIDELFKTGTSGHFLEIMKGLPTAMFDLMEVPGIGVKTAYKLASVLKIKSIGDLEKAAKEGRIAKIENFGEQSQEDILRSISEIKGRTVRHLLPYALNLAGEIIAWMLNEKSVLRVDPLGSLRRHAATVGDIDLAVATNMPEKVIKHFTNYPKKVRILEKGEKSASIILPGDVQVDLMVQPPDAYGSLLQHFTGSKHHNIALREFALKRGLSLSEYGIKEKTPNNKSNKLQKFASEEEFYNKIELSWIPPELREDTGEIEAAYRDNQGNTKGLPDLVELADVKGDLQIHSSYDIETSHDLGSSTFAELVAEADQLGYEYIAFTEHNPSRSRHSDSQILDIIKRKKEAIDVINYSIVKKGFKRIRKVFNSLEIDIIPDGRLALPEAALSFLDFALVSIHSSFQLERKEMTNRILNALSFEKVKILAHPTARKLNQREGIEISWPDVFEFAINNKKYIEINAEPSRLDLPDTLVREAIKLGVKLTLGTDSHHKDSLKNMIHGVSVARRGWASKNDILNTLSLKDFEKVIL